MNSKISGKSLRKSHLISKSLFNILKKDQPQPKDITVVCIGTDRSTGDSLGPLIGSRLNKITTSDITIKGTLESPVHATNITETLLDLNKELKSPYIIAVDACLGKPGNVGKVIVKEGPVKPGAGVKKDLEPVGNCHVSGIVNVGGFMEYMVLQNTRLYEVTNLSVIISRGISWATNHYIKKVQTESVPKVKN